MITAVVALAALYFVGAILIGGLAMCALRRPLARVLATGIALLWPLFAIVVIVFAVHEEWAQRHAPEEA